MAVDPNRLSDQLNVGGVNEASPKGGIFEKFRKADGKINFSEAIKEFSEALANQENIPIQSSDLASIQEMSEDKDVEKVYDIALKSLLGKDSSKEQRDFVLELTHAIPPEKRTQELIDLIVELSRFEDDRDQIKSALTENISVEKLLNVLNVLRKNSRSYQLENLLPKGKINDFLDKASSLFAHPLLRAKAETTLKTLARNIDTPDVVEKLTELVSKVNSKSYLHLFLEKFGTLSDEKMSAILDLNLASLEKNTSIRDMKDILNNIVSNPGFLDVVKKGTENQFNAIQFDQAYKLYQRNIFSNDEIIAIFKSKEILKVLTSSPSIDSSVLKGIKSLMKVPGMSYEEFSPILKILNGLSSKNLNLVLNVLTAQKSLDPKRVESTVRMILEAPRDLRIPELLSSVQAFSERSGGVGKEDFLLMLYDLPMKNRAKALSLVLPIVNHNKELDQFQFFSLLYAASLSDGEKHVEELLKGQIDYFNVILTLFPDELKKDPDFVERVKNLTDESETSITSALKLLSLIPQDQLTEENREILGSLAPLSIDFSLVPADLLPELLASAEKIEGSEKWKEGDLLAFIKGNDKFRERVLENINAIVQSEHKEDAMFKLSSRACSQLEFLVPDFNDENSIYQMAQLMMILSSPENLETHSPFELVENLRALRDKGGFIKTEVGIEHLNLSEADEMTDEKRGVWEGDASWNLDVLRAKGKEGFKVLTNDDLPKVDRELMGKLFDQLEKRAKENPAFGKQIQAMLPPLRPVPPEKEGKPMTLDMLRDGFMSDYIKGLLALQGKPGVPINQTQLKLFTILKVLMKESTELKGFLTPQEEMLLKFACSVQECRVGQAGGIEEYYQLAIPSKDRISGSGAEGKVEDKAGFLVDLTIQDLLEQTFSNNELIKNVTGKLSKNHPPEQGSHDIRYLKNVLAHQVGLANYTIEFDPYSHVIDGDLTKRSPESLLIDYLSFLKIEDGIELLQKRFVDSLKEAKDDAGKSDIDNGFIKLIQKAMKEGGETLYDIDEYIDHSDPDVPVLTKLGALTLLKARGFVETAA